jgi:cytokinesis protein
MFRSISQIAGHCLTLLLQNATRDALTHNLFVAQIASSFNSPRLPARKLVAELLTFLTYRIPEALNLITGALEAVSIANNAGNSPYTYWFASFEKSISGRGKMGSLVGASDEVRKNATTESNINEYAVRLLLGSTASFSPSSIRFIVKQPSPHQWDSCEHGRSGSSHSSC